MDLEKEMREMCNIDDTEGLNKDTNDIYIPNAIKIAKQYGKQARIDELENLKRADRTIGLLIDYEATHRYIESRLKELNK